MTQNECLKYKPKSVLINQWLKMFDQSTKLFFTTSPIKFWREKKRCAINWLDSWSHVYLRFPFTASETHSNHITISSVRFTHCTISIVRWSLETKRANFHSNQAKYNVNQMRLYFLKQLKRAGLAADQLRHFYLSAIRPILEYCSVVWHHGLTKTQVEQLEAIQRRAIQIIF